MRKWLDAGLHPAASSDAPVCNTDPFKNLFTIVTRQSKNHTVLGEKEPDDGRGGARLYVFGAYTQFAEDRVGRLVPGQLADIAILSRDVFACDPQTVEYDVRCDMTILGGEVVFDRKGPIRDGYGIRPCLQPRLDLYARKRDAVETRRNNLSTRSENTMNGADRLCDVLLANDVDVCFANPGTSEMHFVAALDRKPRMRCVLGLFEGVVTAAADGYARMADKPAATLLHLGPGLANGLANLHNARRAHTPMINVVGDHATYHLQHDAPLTSDIESLARPMSHWVRRIADAESVGPDTAAAYQAAMSLPGIATLILPADAAWGEVSDTPITRAAVPGPNRSRPRRSWRRRTPSARAGAQPSCSPAGRCGRMRLRSRAALRKPQGCG